MFKVITLYEEFVLRVNEGVRQKVAELKGSFTSLKVKQNVDIYIYTFLIDLKKKEVLNSSESLIFFYNN